MTELSLEDVIPLPVAEIAIPDLPVGHPLARLSGTMGAVMAFAVVQRDGVILFETGVGRPHFATVSSQFGAWLHERYRVIGRGIEHELEVHGLATGDVRAIVNSHLHWDHCGGNPLFPGVPIYVQAAEYNAARHGGRAYTVPEWVDFPGAEFVVVDGEAAVAKGIHVLSTPGHTPGHQSLIVETRQGRVALAGQAIYLKEEYEQIVDGGAGYGGGVDAEQMLVSARRLRDQRAARVHFSHDRAVWTNEPALT